MSTKTVADLTQAEYEALPPREQAAVTALLLNIEAGKQSEYTSDNDLTPTQLADEQGLPKTPMTEKQVSLLQQIVEVSDRLETGNCPNIYSSASNVLRALERRGYITYEGNRPDYTRPSSEHRVVFTATPTQLGRLQVEALAKAVA